MIRSGLQLKQSKLPAAVGTGSVISVVITFILTMLIAALVNMERITEENVGYYVLAIMLVSSYTGGYIACRKMGSKRLMVSLLSGTVFLCILVGINILLYEGKFEAVGQTYLLIMCGSILSSMWTSRDSIRTKNRKYRF